MSKKTVYIFRQYASTPNVPGGTRHFNLAKELVEKGINVYIFASNFNHLVKRNVKNFKGLYFIERINGVNFIWMNTFKYYYNNWRRIVNMIDYAFKSYKISLELFKMGVKPDIVIGSVAHIFSVWSAYITGKSLKAKFFIDVGDLWPEAFVTSGKMSEKDFLFKLLKKAMFYFYERADKILCLSTEMEKYFKNVGYGRKVILIPPGIKINKNFNLKERLEKPKEVKIIYAGSFQPLYPLDKVIMAAKIVQDLGHEDIKFIFIGDGTQKKDLITMSKKFGLSNVEFLDPLPKEQLLEFLKIASAFILIEKDVFYGFPNKLLDYLYVGRPIIYASPVRYEVLKSGCCIEASYEDPKSVAHAVMKVASMREAEWKEMAVKARNYLLNNHDVSIIAQKLIEALNC